MSKFHFPARGLYVADDHVLLAHFAGADNTFLPGGHIGIGEKATDCLLRELKEELALENIGVGRFLGAIEHKWEDNEIVARLSLPE